MTTTAERVTQLREWSDVLGESIVAGMDLLWAVTNVESDEYLDLVRFDVQIAALRSIDVSLERLRIAIENR